MPALFPRWSNTVLWLGLATVGLGVVGVPVAAMIYVRTPWVTNVGRQPEQPVMIDHRHHTRDEGIDCRYCHSTVERSRYAGVPATSTCMGCHGQVWNDAELLAPVRASYFEDKPIAWKRVYGVPDYVRFDHSIHVKKGVGCSTCHGSVDRMARVEAVSPLTMQWCLDCHRDPVPSLRPLDHITDIAWAPTASEQRAIGPEVARALDVHPPTHCTACHF